MQTILFLAAAYLPGPTPKELKAPKQPQQISEYITPQKADSAKKGK